MRGEGKQGGIQIWRRLLAVVMLGLLLWQDGTAFAREAEDAPVPSADAGETSGSGKATDGTSASGSGKAANGASGSGKTTGATSGAAGSGKATDATSASGSGKATDGTAGSGKTTDGATGSASDAVTEPASASSAEGASDGVTSSTGDASKSEITRRLEEERQKAEQYEAQETDLSERIDAVNKKLSDAAVSLGETREALAELEDQIAANEVSLSDLEGERERTKCFLYAYIKRSYETQAGTDIVTVMSEAGSVADFLSAQFYASRMLDYFYEQLDKYQDLDALYRKRHGKLVALRKEQKSREASLAEKRETFTAQLAELSSMLKETEHQALDAAAQADALAGQLAAMEAAERAALEAAASSDTAANDSAEATITPESGTDYYEVGAYDYTDEELLLLAGLMQAEAGSGSYPGMVAVGSVVMNRVADARFPGSIAGVIYAPGQFSPAGSGRLAVILAQGPADLCVQAARDVLGGKRNVANLYFKADWYAKEHGISGVNIGGNVFH